jgi:hypothetical protein
MRLDDHLLQFNVDARANIPTHITSDRTSVGDTSILVRRGYSTIICESICSHASGQVDLIPISVCALRQLRAPRGEHLHNAKPVEVPR